jgi:murein DD-endopeptidase MepM/ murein hydrolase activator NlpD
VRSFTVRPWLLRTFGGGAPAFAALYFAATGYLVFRDDILAASIARQTRMQHAYEDRIASLRSDIDRLTSRQLLNQQSVEAELGKLLGRQAALDARQDVIAALSQAARRVGMAASPATAAAAPDLAVEPDTDEPADSVETAPLAPARAGTPASLPGAVLRSSAIAPAGTRPLAQMDAVSDSLDELAREQVAYVDAVADGVSMRTGKIAAVLKRLGQKVPPSRVADADDAVGGPFVPLDEDANPETFRSNVALLTDEVERFGVLRRIATALPLTRPIANAAITSRFGARMDPFLGRPAMHPGIDFRAPRGFPARVTAGGTVITAEYSGGYGNMVEVDHGNGISTRYGHLSSIEVTVGQVVAKGAILGRTGSTGRSTGPHLHYEVRVDGGAIDPMTYIRAGSEIAPLL